MGRWIVARTRPDEGAPSCSIGVEAGSPNLALIRFLERYEAQPIGTRIDVRVRGAHWRDSIASYERTEHRWVAR
jgi:hypothetical protein